ncbi:sulfotransferase [Demequina flava]|uniref:sulfotransferase n=1 Tax=Demequina flava TaxID=1095025 RepID=UPI000782CC5E|nr:sulfotransferase [Demequina flava]
MLGVGAQKAATTWLYDYLRRSPQFVHRLFKEYHVFDSSDAATQEWSRKKVFRLSAENSANAKLQKSSQAKHLLRASMVLHPKHYYGYFDTLLCSGPEFRLAADVTPAYALLSADRYAKIRTAFKRRGIRARAVFLMRDPVERAYSQVRMEHRRDPERFTVPPEQALRDLYTHPGTAARGRYDQTIANLEQAFPDSDLHYEFYERLFSKEAVGRVCEFLVVDYIEPDFAYIPNVTTGSKRHVPGDLAQEIAEYHRLTCHKVQQRFPSIDLCALWPSARHVL